MITAIFNILFMSFLLFSVSASIQECLKCPISFDGEAEFIKKTQPFFCWVFDSGLAVGEKTPYNNIVFSVLSAFLVVIFLIVNIGNIIRFK